MEKNGSTLPEEQLGAVSGGSDPAFQLYYKGAALPMSSTVAELCGTYPEIRQKLGGFYLMFAAKTLNELCATWGQDTVQALIDQNS